MLTACWSVTSCRWCPADWPERPSRQGRSFHRGHLLLGNIDTTDVIRYPAGGGIGSAKKVLTWQQIQQVMNPTTSGGEQQFVQYQYLEDDDQRQLPTFRNAQSFSMPIADDPNLPQWAVIEAADQSKALQVIRLTLRNGSEVFYNGYVSVSDTPTLNVNEIMTRTLTIALDGRPVRYNPPPKELSWRRSSASRRRPPSNPVWRFPPRRGVHQGAIHLQVPGS